jgi:hypothetical protein
VASLAFRNTKIVKQTIIVQGTSGAIGIQGPSGFQGQPGLSIQGPQGIPGTPGQSVTADQIALAVTTYLQANPPPAGANGQDGAPGDPGQPAREIQLRTNPQNGNLEWKYTDDLSWNILTRACMFTGTCT